MRFRRLNDRTLSGFLLLALALRALIPVGFMPSPERPFAFEICPDGLPASIAATVGPASSAHSGHHHHMAGADPAALDHGHSGARADHCPFAVGAAAPSPHIASTALADSSFAAADGAPAPLVLANSRYRVQQPRGPPTLAAA